MSANLDQPGQSHPVVRPLLQQLLEVEHGRLVVVLPEGEVGHHDSGLLVVLVIPEESHAGVLALVQVVVHQVELGQGAQGDLVLRVVLQRLLVLLDGAIVVALHHRVLSNLVADLCRRLALLQHTIWLVHLNLREKTKMKTDHSKFSSGCQRLMSKWKYQFS